MFQPAENYACGLEVLSEVPDVHHTALLPHIPREQA